jgi:hypothetical protein
MFNKLIPLFCRIIVDSQEVRFGMKYNMNPKFWDVKAGQGDLECNKIITT